MVWLSVVLACLAILADAWTTRAGLMHGRTEENPVRRAAIRLLGIGGGTVGVGVVLCFGIVAGNLWSGQPAGALIVGNCIAGAAFGWAALRNARIIASTVRSGS